MSKKNKKDQGASLASLLWVEVREAKEHPDPHMEQMRPWMRWLLYNKPVACAACGKKHKRLWTMLCEFKAGDLEGSFVVLKFYPRTFAPLTGVCDDHPLTPDFEKAKAAPAAEGNQ